MIMHRTASREEWLKERIALLAEEKELTRRSDALAAKRQALPWVRIGKDYKFQTEQGEASLLDLFQGRSQLMVYHFMFGPSYQAGCPSCSMIADGFNGFVTHLTHHDVAFSAVSRAPLDTLLSYRRRMGWQFPWASSEGGDFNYDFNVSVSDEQPSSSYNYAERGHKMTQAELPPVVHQFASMCGTDAPSYVRDRPGMSSFVREGGEIYHCYSAYARGLDALWGAYQWLDRAPLGRNEETGPWWKRNDEYAA